MYPVMMPAIVIEIETTVCGSDGKDKLNRKVYDTFTTK